MKPENPIVFETISKKFHYINFGVEIIVKVDEKRTIKLYVDPIREGKLREWEIMVSDDWKDTSRDIYNSLSKFNQKEIIKHALKSAQEKIKESNIYKMVEK